MPIEKIIINSEHKVLLSESENTDCYDAKFIICDFGINKNNVGLNRDKIENWMSSLNLKPLVGKITTKYNGETDFTGHCMRKIETKDEDGNITKSIVFDTSAFGTFYEIAIETIDEIEYITATSKIWKRFGSACDILKTRIDNGETINTSWEIEVSESHSEIINGEKCKIIDDGLFIGHCLLGKNVIPAFDSSLLLDVASENTIDSEIADALIFDLEKSNDINTSSNEEDNDINNDKQGGKDMAKDINKDIASVTSNDLYTKLSNAVNSVDENRWFYVSYVYPYDFKVICRHWSAEETEFIEFTYAINSDDSVSILSQKDVKMQFVEVSNIEAQLAEKETKISELTTEVTTLKSEIETKVDAITKLGEELSAKDTTISEKDAEISELLPLKEEKERVEAEAKEKEISEKKEALKVLAQKGGYISLEETETSEEIKEAIENLDEKSIKSMIAERVISKLDEKQTETSTETSTEETKQKNVQANLNSSDDTLTSATDIIKNFVKSI